MNHLINQLMTVDKAFYRHYLEAGNVIGYLEIPTKYYSLEGCNLYFEMLKDGQPVNPMDYLAEE